MVKEVTPEYIEAIIQFHKQDKKSDFEDKELDDIERVMMEGIGDKDD